ncbi:MAG: hypothetical protein ABIK62_05645, partial [candidate division WOR-3 bacterium]
DRTSLWGLFMGFESWVGQDVPVSVMARSQGGYSTFLDGKFRYSAMLSDPWDKKYKQPFVSSVIAVDYTPPMVWICDSTDTLPSSLSQVYACWDGYDPESGIEEYQYAIGDACVKKGLLPGGPVYSLVNTSVCDWTSAGGQTSLNIRGLKLEHGKRYYLGVRAKSAGGLSHEAIRSFVPDSSPPKVTILTCVCPNVYETGLSRLEMTVKWEATDNESGVLKTFRWLVGRKPFGSDFLDTTITFGVENKVMGGGSTIEKMHNKVHLGDTVFVTVKACNCAGLIGFDTVHFIFRDPTPPAPFAFYILDKWDGPKHILALVRDYSWDEETGVLGYEYRVEDRSSARSLVLIPWTKLDKKSTPIWDLAWDLPPQTPPEKSHEALVWEIIKAHPELTFTARATNGAGMTTTVQTTYKFIK